MGGLQEDVEVVMSEIYSLKKGTNIWDALGMAS